MPQKIVAFPRYTYHTKDQIIDSCWTGKDGVHHLCIHPVDMELGCRPNWVCCCSSLLFVSKVKPPMTSRLRAAAQSVMRKILEAIL